MYCYAKMMASDNRQYMHSTRKHTRDPRTTHIYDHAGCQTHVQIRKQACYAANPSTMTHLLKLDSCARPGDRSGEQWPHLLLARSSRVSRQGDPTCT